MSKLTPMLAAALLSSPLAATAADQAGPKLTLNGTVDTYYTLNLTQGQSDTSPTGGVTAFTGFNLNYAKLSAVAESGPAALRLDLAYGPTGEAVTGLPPGGTPSNITKLLVQQAYATMKFGRFTVDAGRFVSPAGFEITDAKDNWLYSRGLIYNFAIPRAHEGVRVSTLVTPELTLTGYLANGSDLWNNDLGFTGSPYKTLILGGVYAKDDTRVSANLFISKDPVTADDAFLIDAVFTQGLGATSFNVSADYGNLGSSAWFAVGGSVKHTLTDSGLKLVGRIEYLNDQDGIHTGFVDANGNGVTFMSFTGGLNYPVGNNAELRGELRLDRASEKVYAPADPSETIVTFTAAAIAWF